jgi:hypothetical protein
LDGANPQTVRPHGAPNDANAAADWFRDLARALRISRLYSPGNAIAVQARQRLAATLADQLERHGIWAFRITPTEIRLGDQPVVRPAPATAGEEPRTGLLERLPFFLYRDGVRGITFLPGIPPRDVEAFVDALALGCVGVAGADDIVTSLWQANPTHIRLESLPLEQTLHLYSDPAEGGASQRGLGLSFGLPPVAQEIRGDLGQASGPAGLHVDDRDIDGLPTAYVDARGAYETLLATRDAEFARLRAEWEREAAEDPAAQAGRLLRRMIECDGSPEMRAAVAHQAVGWIGAALGRSAWAEARAALDLLRDTGPAGGAADAELAAGLADLADESLGDSLDEAAPEDQARFFAFLVGLGRAGAPLALAVLAGASRPRSRAGAATALSYLCSDEPALLAEALADPRPAFVRDVVAVLGQIGGPEVVSLLALAASHPDLAVRREVVAALAAVPTDERTGVLLSLLAKPDPRLLPALLRVARLEPDPSVARALLGLIEAPDFEERGDEAAFALFAALADAGGAESVAPLAAMLLRGGWLARSSVRRTGAAHTLARLGAPAARGALADGLRARSAAVRTACREALDRREAA